MIGNSPKSDVNPSLAVGMSAVFIPHDYTWVLEHEVVDQPKGGQQAFGAGSIRGFADAFLVWLFKGFQDKRKRRVGRGS